MRATISLGRKHINSAASPCSSLPTHPHMKASLNVLAWVTFSPIPVLLMSPCEKQSGERVPGPEYATSVPLQTQTGEGIFVSLWLEESVKVQTSACSESAVILLLWKSMISSTALWFKFAAPLWSLNDFSSYKLFSLLFCIKLLILSQSGNVQELQNTLLGDLALCVFILHQSVNNPPLICWLPSLFGVSFCHKEPLTVISKFLKLQLCQIIK